MFIINANIVKYSPPPITSVHQTTLQIGAVKVFLPSVNKYKTISQYRITYTLCGGLNNVNYLNIPPIISVIKLQFTHQNLFQSS